MGEARWFLGISLHFDHEHGITTLSQAKFAADVTKRFGMDNCRPRKTPQDRGTILYKRTEEDEPAEDTPYRQAVGVLLYLARVTRPDISYAVNQVAVHASDPSKAHWVAEKNIFRYIDATKSMSLTYYRTTTEPHVRVYTDADWANNEADRRSVSGSVIQVFGSAVSWQTKRQRAVSKSSTIAEYIAVDDGVDEARWAMSLVVRLMKLDHVIPIPAMIGNKSTIKRLTNGRNSDAQKTVDCKFFSVREAVDNGELELAYCPTNVMLADMLTKALPTTRFRELRKALGVCEFTAGVGEVLEHPA
ncbi:Retrovirus-related Gag-pol Polyprotein [Phytophthora megakarya]|uniref:Retrovirus-related Gag-pol Polyprotein n=1 Tax=Phytophthora megakarya TaxID=4795 RepID=A0A225WAC5_9STRA|nr:Retrovirus-related Gag-pol Polyprotein [Phytophthora megakarya]